MPSAKQLLAKLTSFYHRIKPSTTPRIIDDKQRAKVSHKAKAANTNIKLDSIPQDNELQLAIKEPQATSHKSKHPKKPQTESSSRSAHTKNRKDRMEAGYEEAADDSDLNEGPILEAGISRMAFCRKLDTLLQRGLGVDGCNDRCWPRANSSYC